MAKLQRLDCKKKSLRGGFKGWGRVVVRRCDKTRGRN
jgi:hypothetical protein